MAQQPHKEGILSQTKVLVHNGPIQSHLVTRETRTGHVPLASLPAWPGQTAGNSRGHSLVQVSECGNELNQAWESCTTIRQSGDRTTHEKWYDFQRN